jgi:hypothetical protein
MQQCCEREPANINARTISRQEDQSKAEVPCFLSLSCDTIVQWNGLYVTDACFAVLAITSG